MCSKTVEIWKVMIFEKTLQVYSVSFRTHCTHQGVEYTDSEGGAAGEGLSEVQLCVGVVIVILVQELNIWVIHWEKETCCVRDWQCEEVWAKHTHQHTPTPTHLRVKIYTFKIYFANKKILIYIMVI